LESVQQDPPGSNNSKNKMAAIANFQKQAKHLPGVTKDEIDFLDYFILENYDLLIKNENNPRYSYYASDGPSSV